MKKSIGTPRVLENEKTNAELGLVKWSPAKSLWFSTHFLLGTAGSLYFFTPSGFIVFVVFTSITLCFGHSLGMHRNLIHSSYECPKWMEYLFVHLGVLVGMAGPKGMIAQHDLRDWAQRKNNCHNYLRHGEPFLKDGWWQLHCDLTLDHAPVLEIEKSVENDKIYEFMEKYWMLQQLPWAIVFFLVGGLPWVLWGISSRIAISVTGHWLIGYFAHNSGHRDWHVDGAAVQGHNVKFGAILTMGESWHNNHHAFPGSAMLGIHPGQPDPGWWVLNALKNLGLVWSIKLPGDLPSRPELQKLNKKSYVRTT